MEAPDYGALFPVVLHDYLVATEDVDAAVDRWLNFRQQVDVVLDDVDGRGVFHPPEDVWIFTDWDDALERHSTMAKKCLGICALYYLMSSSYVSPTTSNPVSQEKRRLGRGPRKAHHQNRCRSYQPGKGTLRTSISQFHRRQTAQGYELSVTIPPGKMKVLALQRGREMRL